jgi:Tol biopolymer transport system component
LEGDFDPAWSPDGDWIAYTSLINGQMQLMKIPMGGGPPIKLSDGTYDDSDPAWSPDGEQLVFIRIRSVNQVWLMDADGEDPIQFTRSGLIDNSNPTWFPDKNLILFSQVLGLGSPSKQLFGMRLEDIGESEEYSILPSSNLDYIPLMDNVDVSEDGFWLAFDYWYFDVLSDVTIMTFPGGNLIQMTEHPEMDYDPAWRPQS